MYLVDTMDGPFRKFSIITDTVFVGRLRSRWTVEHLPNNELNLGRRRYLNHIALAEPHLLHIRFI